MGEPVPSPCRKICRLGADGACDGCGRTIDEIIRWMVMPPEEQRAVAARVAGWRVRGDRGPGA